MPPCSKLWHGGIFVWGDGFFVECRLCPRECGVDRSQKAGYCGMGEKIIAAKAMLHHWEEPCISGTGGSGAVFFSGCILRCVYCQNYEISTEKYGKEITVEPLSEVFLELQDQGAENIDLVNPTHFVPQIIEALRLAKDHGLRLPIVYNSGGYEKIETLKSLDGVIDVYLPDVKYYNEELAIRLSNAPNYFNTAMAAVEEMVRQTGKPVLVNGKLLRGTIVRHLVLPNCYKDSVEIVKRLGERLGGEILFSLMSQYTPFGQVKTDPEISKMNRRITTFEYNKVLDAVIEAGLEGYMQERSSAKEEYTPEFDLKGI